MKIFKTIAGLISLTLAMYAFSTCGGVSGTFLSGFLIIYGVAAILTRKSYIGGKIKVESYVLFFAWLVSIALLIMSGREGVSVRSDAALGAFVMNVAWTLACFTFVTQKGIKAGDIEDAQKKLAEKQSTCPRCGSGDIIIQFVETGSKAHTDVTEVMRGKVKGNKLKSVSNIEINAKIRNKMKKVAICQKCGNSWQIWL